jgi:2-amino-4-hydroxy-6-hydroxymethyldihydropteridine diphosphokinase
MTKKNFIIIALGSNLGDKYGNLRCAVEGLKAFINIDKISSIYKSEALLPNNAPDDWNKSFYNCVLCGYTDLQVDQFFDICNKVEGKNMPLREKGAWAPRELDIDILAFNDEIMETEALSIPHKRMLERNFVVLPLFEILPDWRHPLTNRSISEYVNDKFSLKIKKLDLGL